MEPSQRCIHQELPSGSNRGIVPALVPQRWSPASPEECTEATFTFQGSLWKPWHRSPALFAFPQRDVRTLVQCVPCLSTSQALCGLGGGLRARWRAEILGRDGFNSYSSCMCVWLWGLLPTNPTAIPSVWREQLSPEGHASMPIVPVLGSSTRAFYSLFCLVL